VHDARRTGLKEFKKVLAYVDFPHNLKFPKTAVCVNCKIKTLLLLETIETPVVLHQDLGSKNTFSAKPRVTAE